MQCFAENDYERNANWMKTSHKMRDFGDTKRRNEKYRKWQKKTVTIKQAMARAWRSMSDIKWEWSG